MTHIVRPLTADARARAGKPRYLYSPFHSTWKQTLDLAEREVSFLQDGFTARWVLMIDVDESKIRRDGEIRADARTASPIVAVALDRRGGKSSLLFACARFDGWQDNVRAIALGMEALRKVERYGIGKGDEQYRGWQALPPGRAMPPVKMTKEEAAKVLIDAWPLCVTDQGIDASIRWIIDDPKYRKVVYHQGATKLHPDQGGDPAAFRLLTEARDLLDGR